MAHISSNEIVLQAVLTRKGQELLARGDGSFSITQVAFADDGVDYTDYDPSHPSGSAYFGEAIVNTPLLEPFVDESKVMQSKLLTLPRGTSKIPVIDLGMERLVLKQGTPITITPATLNFGGTSTYESTSGYIMTISDARLVSNFRGVGINETIVDTTSITGTSKLSKSVIGTSFSITASSLSTLFTGSITSLTTILTVIGRESGARITIPLIITKNS